MSTAGTSLRYSDLDFDRSITYGGRFGAYFEAAPWVGLAVDALNFDPDVSSQSTILKTGAPTRTVLPPMNIAATAISVDLMLRATLFATKEIPGGRGPSGSSASIGTRTSARSSSSATSGRGRRTRSTSTRITSCSA
jgi:hypothetical protein